MNESDASEMDAPRAQAGKETRTQGGIASGQGSAAGGGGERMEDWQPSSLLGAMGLELPVGNPGMAAGRNDVSAPQISVFAGGGVKAAPGSEQADIGVTPHPLDPFQMPATNWDALAVAAPGPEVPAEWSRDATQMPMEPLPFLRFDGKPCGRLLPNQRAAATQALVAFDRIHSATNASWNAMVPGITSYVDASKDVVGAGMLGSEGGLGWNEGSVHADLGKLTGQQKIGPDNKKTIDDLFKNKDGTTSDVSAPGATGTKKSKELLNSAKRASNEVRTAVSEHKIAQTATKGTAEGVRAAVLLVQINEAKFAAEELQAKKEELQKDKADAEETLDAVVSNLEALTLIGFGVADATSGGIAHGAESIMIGVEIGAEVIGKAMINAKYDAKIEVLDRQLQAALSNIRSKQASYVQSALTSAKIAHDTALARVRTTRETMLAKVAAYQSAYDQFAEEAGKAAGGGAKGAQVQAALEAVPRVEHCLGQIRQITSSIALPAYTEESGKGFNGFGKPASFVTHLGQLKGYREKFHRLEETWKARLVSLKGLEKQLGT